jgi:flavorubredoxin
MRQGDTVKIADSIYWVGAQDRETDLFEGLWRLPHGIAYNAYLLDGEKSVLIDTVKNHFADDFLDRVFAVLEGRPLDYVVVNHMEPDHAGSLSILRRLYPGVTFVGNAKTAEMMKNFFGIEDNVLVVKEGEAIDLGPRRFVFAFTPMVHWPESMVAYDATDKILFSSDIFGGFAETDGGIFDDEADMGLVVPESMRYYVNIVGRFASPALKALSKARGLDIAMLCPAHGPIWRRDPELIISLYEKWSRQETEESVVVVYGSMYGNTKLASETVARALSNEGVKNVRVYDIARSDLSVVATDVWRSSGLLMASCTYNMELFPPMARLIRHIENKNMRGRHVGLIGTYCWAEASLREMAEFVERGKGAWTLVEPKISIKSSPKGDDFGLLESLASNMARAIKK